MKTEAVASVEREIVDNFRIFRDTPPTPMPPEAAMQVGSPERYGRNAALARSIETPHGTGYVIPGDGMICLAVPTPTHGFGTSCLPVALAVERGLWGRIGGNRADGKVLDTIVVPDGTAAETAGQRLTVDAEGVASEFVRADERSGPELIPSR